MASFPRLVVKMGKLAGGEHSTPRQRPGCQEASAPAEAPGGSAGEAEPDHGFRGAEAPADRICTERTARGAGGGVATPHSPPVPRKVELSDHGLRQFLSRAETTGTSNARPHKPSRTNDPSCAARGGRGGGTAERRRRRAATTRRSSFRHERNRRSAQATSPTPRVRPGHTGHRGWALPASFKRRPCRGLGPAQGACRGGRAVRRGGKDRAGGSEEPVGHN
ncbi:serine/arginine repetitive matrix protein 3-like isoform X2 [Pongo abelii]|uniref:serine/arginine repetitive matrix protein 3-like isoform X2 n=1 Tax=Pongo abelii TaxID=9601 RepID=UPI0023E827BC|nr:serine/arginine repetitive matrix protein 3-like isoform X2 [Pongo abelii]